MGFLKVYGRTYFTLRHHRWKINTNFKICYLLLRDVRSEITFSVYSCTPNRNSSKYKKWKALHQFLFLQSWLTFIFFVMNSFRSRGKLHFLPPFSRRCEFWMQKRRENPIICYLFDLLPIYLFPPRTTFGSQERRNVHISLYIFVKSALCDQNIIREGYRLNFQKFNLRTAWIFPILIFNFP